MGATGILPKRKSNKAAAAVLLLVIIVIIFGALGYWVYSVGQEEVRLLNEGCEPKAWNQWGQVTLWTCPPGVRP